MSMRVEVSSFIFDEMPDSGHDVRVIAEHGEGPEKAFAITVGCVDHWLSEPDFNTLYKCMTRAKRERKEALK